MDKARTAATANTVLWVVTIIAAAVLGKGSDQALMLILVPVIAGGVSIYFVAEAARQR